MLKIVEGSLGKTKESIKAIQLSILEENKYIITLDQNVTRFPVVYKIK